MGSLDEFLNWLKKNHEDYYNKLINAKNSDGSFGKEFDAAWKAIATNDPDGFSVLQYNYYKTQSYDVVMKNLADKGFDMSDRSFALRSVIWSTMAQHGVAGATKMLLNKIDLSASDKNIINQIYDERSQVDIYFRSSSEKIKQSVKNRFVKEREKALDMLEAE